MNFYFFIQTRVEKFAEFFILALSAPWIILASNKAPLNRWHHLRKEAPWIISPWRSTPFNFTSLNDLVFKKRPLKIPLEHSPPRKSNPPKRNLMWKIKIQGIPLLEGNTKKGDIKKSFLFHSLYNIMKGIIMVLSKFKDIVLFLA